jgi:hypothetical protein
VTIGRHADRNGSGISINGRTWQRVPSPDAPGRRTSSFLNAVAATSRRNARAVGESNLAGGTTLIERWNGARWTVAAVSFR